MKAINIKNSELWGGSILLAMGLLIFVGITNSLRYLGLILFVVGIVYFIRFFYSNSRPPKDDRIRSKTRDQIFKYRNKR